jgi:2,4-dienoyl-CoA reductase-like NADH-dependent reductase (Old Yellow Enzyme family)
MKAFQEFRLPNGSVLKNRIAKAAMQECLSDVAAHCQPSDSLVRLYETWGKGGAGLILSGHVMLDPTAVSAPGDIVLAEDAGAFDEQIWRQWIDSTQKDGVKFYFQLNHPGRQVMKGNGFPTYAPSAVPLKMGAMSGAFDVPLALTEEHIQDIIRRFVWTARKAEELGVSGVEIHAAHGYLISQFLNPNSNKRTDKWGGSLENRARMLFEVVKAVRKGTSPKFGVGVKINSSDFQKGGFTTEDLLWVVEQLNTMNLDFLELSGGSYEQPAMSGFKGKAASTVAREAYFLEAAKELEAVAKMPLMVTGGISHLSTLETVINSSDNIIAGVGSALGYMPDLPNRWARGEDPAPQVKPAWWLPRSIQAVSKIMAVQFNMERVGEKKKPWLGLWPLFALVMTQIKQAKQMKSYKQWSSSLVKTQKTQ